MKRADGSKGTSESKERSGEVRFHVGVIGVDATCPPATGKVSGGQGPGVLSIRHCSSDSIHAAA